MTFERNLVGAIGRIGIVALSLLSSSVLADSPQLRVVTTPKFTLYTVQSEAGARKMAEALLTLDSVARRTAGAAPQDVAPTRIFVVSSRDWEPIFESWSGVAGFFAGGWLASDIVAPVRDDLREVLFHEYVHHLLHDQVQLVWPAWFSEGVAQLLSNMEFKGERATFKPPARLTDYLTQVRWMPTETVLNADRRSDEYRSHRMAPSFYAQSWVMAHYAFVENPATLRQIMDHILRVNRGQSVDEALQAFGRSYEELDAEFVRYRNRLQFRDGELRIPPDTGPVKIESRELDATESLIAYLELAVRLELGPQKAALLVDEDQRTRATSPHLLALLALFAQQSEKEGEADAYLARIQPDAAKTDLRTQILMGDVFLERARTLNAKAGKRVDAADPLVERAGVHYRQALAVDPRDLEAIYSFSLTCQMLGTQCEDALVYLQSGLVLAPRNTLLLSAAATTSENLGLRADAKEYWMQVQRYAQDEHTKREAAKALSPD